ncbi:hypothetical protein OB962_18225 [Aeromonas piscicola]|uniref:Phage protein n=1 Tax=Aeromonas piscicola TaxID=600645 RepID=A0ABT7QG18_9GAMM|nr:hypothetical protein [Aeromonas piscicola]MDM5132911.1 hypothetical protein [Aeromonas piscicola]
MSRPDFGTIGSTVSACEGVVQYLKPYLEAAGPGADRVIDRVQTVERHIGRFNEPADITRWMSGKEGGIRIAAMRVVSMRREGNLIGTIEFSAFVFCAEQFGYAKDQRAEVIAGRLATALMLTGGWRGTGASKAPEGVRMDNLYTTGIDELGLAIWSVTWRQDWPLDNPIDPATLDDFLRFNFKAELAAGAPVCEATIELPGPTA